MIRDSHAVVRMSVGRPVPPSPGPRADLSQPRSRCWLRRGRDGIPPLSQSHARSPATRPLLSPWQPPLCPPLLCCVVSRVSCTLLGLPLSLSAVLRRFRRVLVAGLWGASPSPSKAFSVATAAGARGRGRGASSQRRGGAVWAPRRPSAAGLGVRPILSAVLGRGRAVSV